MRLSRFADGQVGEDGLWEQEVPIADCHWWCGHLELPATEPCTAPGDVVEEGGGAPGFNDLHLFTIDQERDVKRTPLGPGRVN